MSETVDPVLLGQIKTILRRDLKLGDSAAISDDMPLVGGDMDLDSLDILLLVSSLEKQFSIKIPSEAVGRWVFSNVSTLAKYVQDNRQTLSAGAATQAVAQEVDWINRLPHGPGFRFVSHVKEIVAGQRAVGVWEVKGNEAFFADHFPGNPIVPGVLLTEAMAQLAGICCGKEKQSGMIVQVDIRFEMPVRPPASIELRAIVAQSAGALIRCDVQAWVGTQRAAGGSITLHMG